VLILDDAAIVNMLWPGEAKTILDWVFLPYIQSQLQHVSRLDIVWDVYRPDNLKADAHSKRGKGIRRRVEASSLIPKNWLGFLRIDDNITEWHRCYCFSLYTSSATAHYWNIIRSWEEFSCFFLQFTSLLMLLVLKDVLPCLSFIQWQDVIPFPFFQADCMEHLESVQWCHRSIWCTKAKSASNSGYLL